MSSEANGPSESGLWLLAKVIFFLVVAPAAILYVVEAVLGL